MATIEIRRIRPGPSLVVEQAEELALLFFGTDPSSRPGGHDEQAGQGDRVRVTDVDVTTINATMARRGRRSPVPATGGVPGGYVTKSSGGLTSASAIASSV